MLRPSGDHREPATRPSDPSSTTVSLSLFTSSSRSAPSWLPYARNWPVGDQAALWAASDGLPPDGIPPDLVTSRRRPDPSGLIDQIVPSGAAYAKEAMDAWGPEVGVTPGDAGCDGSVVPPQAVSAARARAATPRVVWQR